MSGVSGQFATFLQFMHCGLILGILHFATHACARGVKRRKYACDIAYAVVLLAVIFLADRFYGKGLIKTFHVFGILSGVFLYVKIIKQPLDRFLCFVYNKFDRLKQEEKRTQVNNARDKKK